MLSRIYGTAWRDQKELDAYLHQLEEAERRDHRRIGKEMDLFHHSGGGDRLDLLASEGLEALPHMPKTICAAGWTRRGYQEVRTPQLLDRVLWERSGHWENYRQHMFIAQVEDEDKTSR